MNVVQISTPSEVLVQLIISLCHQDHSVLGSIRTTPTNNSRIRSRNNHIVHPWHHVPRTYPNAPSVESCPRENTTAHGTHNKQDSSPPYFRHWRLGSPLPPSLPSNDPFRKESPQALSEILWSLAHKSPHWWVCLWTPPSTFIQDPPCLPYLFT